MNHTALVLPVAVLVAAMLISCQRRAVEETAAPAADEGGSTLFVFPYFLDNGQDGIYLAISADGIHFDGVNGNRPILPAPKWEGAELTRDPSILYHDGVFHMVWTTGWWTRSFGYAHSRDLVHWSEPRKVDIWGNAEGIRNTWAPELFHDDETGEYFVLWSTTTDAEVADGDGSIDPHDLDHRIYITRTLDFDTFSPPELFYSPQDPEHGVIDAFIARDDTNGRWVMVIKNEMGPEDGGKNLRLAFSERMQGPYDTTLGPPIVGAGTTIMNRMAEGPTLLHVEDQWWLYWDIPGSDAPYGLATSPDLAIWTNRTDELTMPVDDPFHGTIVPVPASAVGWRNN